MKITRNTTIGDLQDYIWKMNQERGFNLEDPSMKLLMLTEEVGELAKALRKTVGLSFSKTTQTKEVEEELADVLIVLLGLSSLLQVDLADATDKKESKNRNRSWG